METVVSHCLLSVAVGVGGRFLRQIQYGEE
jgi:hypothetical protein